MIKNRLEKWIYGPGEKDRCINTHQLGPEALAERLVKVAFCNSLREKQRKPTTLDKLAESRRP